MSLEKKVMKGPAGQSRDLRNLDYWAARASENSFHGGERAAGKTSTNGVPKHDLDPPKVHSTGKKVELPSTSVAAYERARERDVMAEAKARLNHATDSSPYMKSIRRTGA
jgi:hypothetical protein